MTTLTVDAHREKMMALLSQERQYEFLLLAEPFLRACPDDIYIRLMVIRSYVKLALFGPARDTLEDAFARGMTSAELESLRDSLGTLPDDRIEWSAFADRYRANLDALTQRGVDTTPIETAWLQRHADYALLRDANGILQVRRSHAEDGKAWFPSIRNHPVADQNEPLPDSLDMPMPLPLIFDGIGLGGFFERAYEKSLHTFHGFSCALYVVEPEGADFAVALHLRDWSTLLSDPRVLVFVGPDWKTRMRRFWNEQIDVPLPALALSIGPRSAGAEPDRVLETVEAAQTARNEAIQQSLSVVEAIYAERTVAYWAKRFAEALRGEGPPLRILATTSKHTTFLRYSMRDTQRALEAIGCECRVLLETTDYEVPSPMTYHQAIRDFEPDLLFSLDHLRASFTGILPKNLPLLTWDQDQLPHIFTQASVAQIAPHDFVVGYCKLRCIDLGVSPSQLLYARVPTCPQQFSGDPLTDGEIEKYSCDVSYVSHAAQTPEAFHREERTSYDDPTVVRLLDTLYELLPRMLARHHTPHQAVIDTVLQDGMRRCGITDLPNDVRARLLSWYLWRLGDRIFRHEALAWVGQWAKNSKRSFRIYGNGWENHPTLGEFAAGPADNGRELICIYRASKINLQLMPAGFIHQRALDGLAAGGFFLTRLTPHCLRGRALRKLINRVRELGLDSTESLLASHDATLGGLLQEFYGEHLGHMTSHYPNLFDVLSVTAEMLYPDEVFDNFERIGFDSPDSFARRADAYLADSKLRTDTASAMRKQVVEQFTYQVAMRTFLEAMTTYLQQAATPC